MKKSLFLFGLIALFITASSIVNASGMRITEPTIIHSEGNPNYFVNNVQTIEPTIIPRDINQNFPKLMFVKQDKTFCYEWQRDDCNSYFIDCMRKYFVPCSQHHDGEYTLTFYTKVYS
jgi:hypothetical protein